MKKTLLLVTCIEIFSLTAAAQIKKGAVLLGGNISINQTKYTSNNTQTVSGFNFNTTVGQFIRQNMAVGVRLGYGHSKLENNYNGNTYFNEKTDRYSGGIFVRKYKKLAKDFYFFGDIGAGYFGSKQTDVEIATNITTRRCVNGIDLDITPGISYRIYKKLQVELLVPGVVNLQYSADKITTVGTVSTIKNFSISSSLTPSSVLNSVSLGFSFIL